MDTKKQPSLTKSQARRIPILAKLGSFPGIPQVEDQSPPVRSAILFACPELDDLPNRGVPTDNAQLKAMLTRLIDEIDSGADMEGRVMNLAIREDDWKKLSVGRRKQPQRPLKVTIRVVRD